MPIYEYVCRACGYDHEALQKISAEPLKECPNCGKPELVKQVSAPSFRLKGSGWYETDFKTDNKRNLAAKESVAAEKKPSTDDKKTDSSKSVSKPKQNNDKT